MKLEQTIVLSTSEIEIISDIMNWQAVDKHMSLSAFKNILREMEIKLNLMNDFITPIHEATCASEERLDLHSKFFRTRNHIA